jgi:hypothetical protein
MPVVVWVIAIGLIFLALAVFLWPRIRPQAKPGLRRSNDFGMEAAEEISIPAYYKTPEHIPDPPSKYGQDRLVLLARNPNWLYAYWEVSAARHETILQELKGSLPWGESQPVLRLYDVTGVVGFNGSNANSFVDIPIQDSADNWNIKVGQPNRTFCLDLGRVLPGGRFITVLRSNFVETPRATISDRIDEEWMGLDGIYRSFTRYQSGLSSPTLIEDIRGRIDLPQGISSPTLSESRKGD